MKAGQDRPEVPGKQGGPRKAALAFIFITVLLDVLAFGSIIPVLPKLVESFVGDTAHAATLYGVMSTIWALMQFFCSPIQGTLSDRYGRRPVILASNFGLGFDFILMALAPNVVWLFIGRVISGITAASFSTAGAYIADVTPPEKRAAGFGMLGAAFGLGFVLGPAMGGVLGHVDPRLPFWVAAALSLANAMYGTFVLPESLPEDKRSPFTWKKANPLGSLSLLRSHPQLSTLAVVLFLMNLAHVVYPSVTVLYMGWRYDWNERTVGLLLAGVGVCSMIVSGGLVKPVVAKLGERKSLVLALVCGAIGFSIYGWAPTGAIFLVGIPIMALWGLASPAAQAMMTKHVPPTAQGRLQGANSSIMAITGIIGPTIFTQSFALAIGKFRAWDLPGIPFYLASTFLALAGLVAFAKTKID